MIIDYRKLNKKIIEIPGAFPTVYENLYTLKGCKHFSKFDLNKGFYQMRVNSKDTYKLSFVTPIGQYEFLRIPFILSSAPKLFHNTIAEIIHDLKYANVY